MTEEHNLHIETWIQKAPTAASLVAIVAACLVLVGWAVDVPILKSFFPGQTSMRPNSAVTYILAGASLWMLQEAWKCIPSRQRLRYLGKTLAVIVFLSGALTFSQYLFGINLGIDQLLFRDTEVPVPGLFPGRMTPTGALSFIFLGCGFLLLDWRKRRGWQPAEFLAFAVILDGMFGVLDYILHPGASLTGIAVNSALLSWVLGSGLLAARAHHRVRKLLTSELFAGAVFRRLIPAAVIIPTVLGMLMWWGQKLGFLDSQIGLTLLVVMSITMLVFIVAWTTESLDEADRGRRAAAVELDVRVRQQAAVVELGQDALTGIELVALMNNAIGLVSRTLSVEFCKVQELLPNGKTLVLRAGTGWSKELVGRATVSVEPDSQAGYVLRSDGPVIVEDLRSEIRFRGSPLLSGHDVISGLSVIIPGKERPFGVLGAHTTQYRSFTKDDVNFLQAVANVLAAAIDRKRAEEDLRRSNRALRTLSECNLTMVRATTEPELLQKVCNLLVEQGGYRMAWVGYAERDQAKTIRPAAVAGAEEGYLASTKITWADEEHGRGPTGTAIRTGRPYVVRNILNDENFAPWREDAARRGYASTVALPLMVNAQPLGALRVYAVAPDAFDEAEMTLLTELAADLAYGVQALRTRAERAQAAEALRKSQESLAEAQRIAHIGSWDLDLVNGRLTWSDEINLIFRLTPTLTGTTYRFFLDSVHPEDRDAVLKAVGGAISQRAPYNLEHRILLPDGEEHVVHVRGKVFYDAYGRPVRMLGTVQDITARKRAEEALRQSEERFRQMAENIREVLWMVDATGRKVLYVSPRCEDVWGRPAEALYGDGVGWLEAIHPEDRERLQSALGEGIPQKEFEAEYRVVWPEGSVHWVRDRSFPVLDQAGQIQRIVGITEDITERRLAEEALLESEERYRQLFNEMNVGCAILEAVCDERGSVSDAWFVDVNPTFENLTGWAKESVLGKRALEVFPEIPPRWVKRLGRVALTGDSMHFEGYSEVFKKHFDLTAFRPRRGRFAIVFADITERKQAEQALEQAERKYHSIFENAMEGIFQVREDGGLLTANPAMARLLGYESTEEFTREVRNIEQHLYIEPRHPSGFIPLLRQQGAISEFETQMRRKDGTVIWVIGSAYAVRDDRGKALYYEGTLRDITEHKKAEEALRQLSSQLLRAQDDERRRIARELHDSTGQYLAALAMNLSWMNQSSGASDAKVRSVVGESIDLVKRCLSEIRNFSYLLHPPVLDEYGLSAALRWYVQGFSKRSRIHVEMDVPRNLPRLTREAETALFRVVQECLTNVHRHSGSSRAKIRLHQVSGSLTLEVSDEGHGISSVSRGEGASAARVGVGIAGIKERLRELGGRLEIDSDCHGTIVRASMPLELEEIA